VAPALATQRYSNETVGGWLTVAVTEVTGLSSSVHAHFLSHQAGSGRSWF